jgi:cell division protein FtsI (penicillin-binding protein 3)
MPDLSGIAKRRLLPLLGREDLKIEIVGDGWVRRQTPAPGVPVGPGSSIRLELE